VALVVSILKPGNRRLVHSDSIGQLFLSQPGCCPSREDFGPNACAKPLVFHGGGQSGVTGQLAANDFG